MRGLVRLLLVCVLATALPLQGALAATRAACSGHGTALTGAHAGLRADVRADVRAGALPGVPAAGAESASSPSLKAASAAVLAVASTAVHDHDGGGRHAAAPGAVDPDSHAGDAPAHGKCSACAACCTAALPPAAVPDLPATTAAPTVFDRFDAAIQAVVTDGLERPPRAHRA